MPTEAERIRKVQEEVSSSLKDIKTRATSSNAEDCMRLAALMVESGMCAAAFEIAVQLAELNSKLENMMNVQGDAFQVRIIKT